MVTTGVPGSAGLRIMIPTGISLLDPEEDEIARGRQPSAGLDRAARDQLQSRLDEQMKEHFPLPGASHLQFWFGENGRQGRTGPPQDNPARSEQDLTPADIRLRPADLEMLDELKAHF